MKIQELMTRDVRACRTGDHLGTAAQLMWDGDCGCIPVLADEDGSRRVVGMITDRDICMAAHFRGCAPSEVRVGEVMSTGVRSVGPGEDLGDAEAVMRDAQVRRLPVMDEDGQLVGVISLADLAREAERERGSRKPAITEEEIGDTLTMISARRSVPIGEATA